MKKFCFSLRRVLSLLLIVSMMVTSAGVTTLASAPTNYKNNNDAQVETQKETEVETVEESQSEEVKSGDVEILGEKPEEEVTPEEETSNDAYVAELPGEYQELEFIESKNNAHIDTGVTGNSGVTTEMEVNLITSSSPAYVYGSRGDSGATRFLLARLSSKFDFAVKDDTKSSDWKLNTWYKLNLETTKSGTKLEVKDETGKLLNTKTTKNTYATNKSIWLFGTNTKSGNWSQAKMKQVKMYEDGLLVRHFVPSYRKEDKVVGMYDLVNDTFYTNANSKNSSATFVAGPEVAKEEDSEEGEEDVPEELGEDEIVDNTPDFGPLAETSSEVEETGSLDETTSGELGGDNNESSSVDKNSEVEEVAAVEEEATKSEAVIEDTKQTYIKDIKMAVESSKEAAIKKLTDAGYTVVEKNLNEGTSGKQIYLGYTVTTDVEKAITSIGERWFNDSGRNEAEYTGSKLQYEYVAVTDFDGTQWNTNEGANGGSRWVYLYTSKDANAGLPIKSIEVLTEAQAKTIDQLKEDNYEVVVNSNNGELADFNRGNSGKKVYIRFERGEVVADESYQANEGYRIDSKLNCKTRQAEDGTTLVELTPEILAEVGITKDGPRRTIVLGNKYFAFKYYLNNQREQIDSDGYIYYRKIDIGKGIWVDFIFVDEEKEYKLALPEDNPEEVKAILSNHLIDCAEKVDGLDESFNAKIKYNLILPKGYTGLSLTTNEHTDIRFCDYNNISYTRYRSYSYVPSIRELFQGGLFYDNTPAISDYVLEIEAIGEDGKVYKRVKSDYISFDENMLKDNILIWRTFNIYVIPINDSYLKSDFIEKDLPHKDLVYSISFVRDKNFSNNAKKIKYTDTYEVWEDEFRFWANTGHWINAGHWINVKHVYYVLLDNIRYYMPENCEGLFANMTELRSVNGLVNLDMSKVKSMKSMFEGDISLRKVELPDNVKNPELYGKLEDVSCIFKDCKNLQDIGGTYFEYVQDHNELIGHNAWYNNQTGQYVNDPWYKKRPLIKGNSIKGINGNFFDQLYGLLADDECIVKIDLGGESIALGDSFPTTYVHKKGEVLELPVKRYTTDRQRFIVGYRDADKYTDAEWYGKLSKKEIFTKIGKWQTTDLNLKPVWYSERPYVKDLFISNDKLSDSVANARGYKYVGMVNKGTKKHKTDIYLYYNTTYDPRDAITSIRVHNSGKKRTESNPYSDHPYTPSHELLYFFYKKIPWKFNQTVKPYDLNEKSGGTFVYLFYAKNPMLGAPITEMELVDNRDVATFKCSSDDEKTKTAIKNNRIWLSLRDVQDNYFDREYLSMDYARHEDRVIGDLNCEAGPELFLVYSTRPRLSNEMLANNVCKNSIDSKHQNGYHWINGNRDYVDNTKQTVLMRNTLGTCQESKQILVGSDLESVLPVLNHKKYEFLGWNVDDDMNNRISAFAVWKEDGTTTTNKQSVKVRYVLPDNKYEEVDLTVGSKFKTMQNTDLRDFEGWYYNDNKVTEVTSDMPKNITLFAKFIDKFNIVVHNGYNNTVKKTLYGEEEYELPDASRDGYIFLGWYMDEELNAKITTLKDLTASKNNTIDLYASWAIKEFTIKYNNINYVRKSLEQPYVFDGEILKEKNSIVPFEGKYVSLQPMTNDGYDFKGWYYDKDFTKPLPTTEDIDKIDLLGYKYEYCLPALQQEKVVNIYAKLEETVCSITYDLVYSDVKFRNGYKPKSTRKWVETIELPLESDLAYDKSKYVFTGWTWRSKYKDGREFNFDNKGAINGRLNHVYDVAVKANFDVAYTITYNLSGGKWESGYTPVTKFGNTQEVIIPAYGKVIRNGYVLVGWKDKDDKSFGKTTDFRLSIMVPKGTNKNKEFTAVWRESYKYEMKYDLNGGSWAKGYKPQTTITENETITLPDASKLTHKDGLAFDGWYVPLGLNPLTTYTPRGTEQKVVAKWRAGKYISEIKMSVDADDKKAQDALTNNGYTLVLGNLNLGTSGKNIYIGYKTTNNANDAIRGIGERWFNGDGRNPSTYIGSYHQYNYTAVTDLSGNQHSTNEGANDGSRWVYLYTTKDNNAGNPITNVHVVGNTVETPVSVLTQNNTYKVVVNSNDNGLADFNRGNTSPRRIYIRYR